MQTCKTWLQSVRCSINISKGNPIKLHQIMLTACHGAETTDAVVCRHVCCKYAFLSLLTAPLGVNRSMNWAVVWIQNTFNILIKGIRAERLNRKKRVRKMEIGRARKDAHLHVGGHWQFETDWLYVLNPWTCRHNPLSSGCKWLFSLPLLSSPSDSMGEEYYIRGAPWIPPFVVVVSVIFSEYEIS